MGIQSESETGMETEETEEPEEEVEEVEETELSTSHSDAAGSTQTKFLNERPNDRTYE